MFWFKSVAMISAIIYENWSKCFQENSVRTRLNLQICDKILQNSPKRTLDRLQNSVKLWFFLTSLWMLVLHWTNASWVRSSVSGDGMRLVKINLVCSLWHVFSTKFTICSSTLTTFSGLSPFRRLLEPWKILLLKSYDFFGIFTVKVPEHVTILALQYSPLSWEV